jgi:hypothetical protein
VTTSSGKLVQNYAILPKLLYIMKKIITFLILLAPFMASAQYADTFSDGDFSVDPVWQGTTQKFIVNLQQQLQLNAPATTSFACLSTASASVSNAVWQATFKAGLLLTSGNYVCFYPVSDAADLSGAINGYYVMIGNTAKEIAFYRQNGAVKTKLAAGAPQRLPTTGNLTEVTVKVTRDAAGNWTVYSKLPSESGFTTECSVTDATFFQSSYSGFFVNYSSTNSTKYYFDDFSASGDPYIDTTPPRLTGYRLTDSSTLEITFSEPVTIPAGALTIPQTPGSFTSTLTGNVLTIHFDRPLPEYQTFSVAFDHIADAAGNTLLPGSISFGLFPVRFGDVTFNEIMCDPSPKAGLPEEEYIELYNRRAFAADLSGWKLRYGSRTYTIASGTLPPQEYLLLYAPQAAATLAPFGTAATMASFPSLSSSGQTLCLLDSNDSLIAFTEYSNKWYRNDFKASGGWALECIDPSNLSGSDDNWKASDDRAGGTPGHVNSVAGNCTDSNPPAVTAVSLDADTLTVRFNKPMLLTQAGIPDYYTLSNVLHVTAAVPDFPKAISAKLVLSGKVDCERENFLTVNGLHDVNGNRLAQTVAFGCPATCERNDIIVNEVLAHPFDQGAVFAELYNRSDKVIDLRDLWLNRIKPSGAVDTGFPVAPGGCQLLPGEYMVLTPSRKGVCDFYTCPDEGRWTEMSGFPSLPDAAGNLMLTDRSGMVIDSMSYDEKLHDPIIRQTAGVSFERINPGMAGNDAASWHSAASTAGYATPGRRNSQYMETDDASPSQQPFRLEEKSFTPDNDGLNDLLLIRYKMPAAGYSVAATVYDAAGRKVKQLANNLLCGTEGSLTWNGQTDSGKTASVGVYVIRLEAFVPLGGKLLQAKLACVVAGK